MQNLISASQIDKISFVTNKQNLQQQRRIQTFTFERQATQHWSETVTLASGQEAILTVKPRILMKDFESQHILINVH